MRPFSSPFRFFSGAWPWERVLDVGGGNNPHPRADVVVDLTFEDDHRWALLSRRRLIIADGHALPFRDHSFDVALCAHLLEHCEDPSAVAGELTRVAQRGITEVPTPYLDLLMRPYDKHLWMFTAGATELLYTEAAASPEIDTAPTTIALFDHNAAFRALYRSDIGIFRLHWKWRSSFNIRRAKRDEWKPSPPSNTAMPWRRFITAAIRRGMAWLADSCVGRIRHSL
jgi:hypothetical protein